MKRGNAKPTMAQALRKRAERRLGDKSPARRGPMPQTDARALVHELQVHQAELEMQNEDLVRAEAVARQAAENYAELFDFAPVAYFVLDSGGIVCDLNLAAAALLGRDRGLVSGQLFERYVRPDYRYEFQVFCERLRGGAAKSTCELTMCKSDNACFEVLMEGAVVEGERAGGGPSWRVAVMDITERRAWESRRNLSAALLELFATKHTRQEYLDTAVRLIQHWSGCEALGIRIMDEQGGLPYAASAGFDAEFLKVENGMSLKEESCCCMGAARQAFDKRDRKLVTRGGSFCCDDLPALLRQLPAGERPRLGANCVKFGFSSIAVIPIHSQNGIMGALHLADRQPAQVSATTVQFLESVAPVIGQALERFQMEAKLAEYRDHLEATVKQRTAALVAANERLEEELIWRRTAEETLVEKAEELKRSNVHLEQFAYVASHDLQEPLRAISGYVRLLQLRFPDKVDGKAREYIEGAADGAARMEQLITDLLTFSRLGTEGGVISPANLDKILQAVLRDLQFSIRAAGATVTSDPLPTLPVDQSQILQLFQNLIGNALKFHGKEPPQIHIGARPEPGRWVIWVRDNGIGIAPEYFERIFQVFQRLHTREKYPGTGIGLAICKKIVERHGGRIWLESEPGRGSTFYFSFPRMG